MSWGHTGIAEHYGKCDTWMKSLTEGWTGVEEPSRHRAGESSIYLVAE
jgi:hypothetical protein